MEKETKQRDGLGAIGKNERDNGDFARCKMRAVCRVYFCVILTALKNHQGVSQNVIYFPGSQPHTITFMSSPLKIPRKVVSAASPYLPDRIKQPEDTYSHNHTA